MQRYFFDIHDDVQALSDTEGEPFANSDEAGKRAAQILSEIALHEPRENACSNLLALVRNEAGRVVFTVALSIVGRRIDAPILLPGCHVGAKRSRRSKLLAA
ncbi:MULTISPECIES: hypothetical protein [unclassified Methylobacterium]|uniref:DUF6894 family protein n=1 Tax=unclassified Methylobacterium TaxID=2615210 RepID=UPI001FBACE0B|nr:MULTISPECIES: hypothetical protein [unclassified Methylobacterium]MCJ2016923.1 hypothetical protein [Methylobacterium sp. E-065]